MSHTVRKLLAALVVVVVVAGVLPVMRVHAGGLIGPRAMLVEYYNLINSRQFGVAYNQWLNPRQTYNEFVAGYGDTLRADAYFGGFQPGYIGGVAGGVPSVLVGYRTNGSVAAFSGCYYLTYNDQSSGIGTWLITGADIQPLSYLPTTDQITTLLATDCYDRGTSTSYYYVQGVLVDYYDRINRQDYAGAYSLWLNPRQTFQDFATGFADTSEVVLFYGAYQFSGNFYAQESGRIPVFLFGFHHDGGFAAYQGCFSVNFNPNLSPQWHIVGANLVPLRVVVLPSAQLFYDAMNMSCY